MSTAIASDDEVAARRAHLYNEKAAAEAGVPYCERTKTLKFKVKRVHYEIFAAIESWRFENGRLVCKCCARSLQMMPPCILHSQPMAICPCSSGFITAIVSPGDTDERTS
jgi:hypothetical protein